MRSFLLVYVCVSNQLTICRQNWCSERENEQWGPGKAIVRSSSLASLQSTLYSLNDILNSIPSFGDRKNDYETVVEYFKTHFLQVHRKNNEEHRVLYTHLTNVVETKTTQGIIRNGMH